MVMVRYLILAFTFCFIISCSWALPYSIGLASQSFVLNQTKISYFMDLNYDDSKKLLGLEGYDFYLEIKYLDGTFVNIGGNDVDYGMHPEATSDIVVAKRMAVLEPLPGSLVYVYVGVWQ